jgi:hypothetical protein
MIILAPTQFSWRDEGPSDVSPIGGVSRHVGAMLATSWARLSLAGTIFGVMRKGWTRDGMGKR